MRTFWFWTAATRVAALAPPGSKSGNSRCRSPDDRAQQVLFMRRFRKIALVVGLLVLAFAAYRVLGVYQFRSGECHAVAPRKFTSTYPKHLRVMTFNIEG